MTIKLLAFAGALRLGSFNRKLVALGALHGRTLGAEVDALDLRDLPMPPYDGDIESAAMPPEVTAFRARIAAASAVLISSPEYNGSIPGTLKNVIDWSSRPPAQPWRGKVVALLGATPGPFATARMLPELRKVLSALGAVVIPSQLGIGRAGEVFTPDGRIRDEGLSRSLEEVVRELVETTRKLAAD
jgi:chromate reductase